MSIPIISAVNSLKENTTYLKTAKSSKFYSSKLLNYVEPIDISGFRKTVFYSEINTNFNIGDRVFILNGNYDSNDFISQDKYTKYTDGYRVLGVDGCRIILDLDYTGELPYDETSIDNFIKVYHVRNQREFDYVNSIKVVIPQINVYNTNNSFMGGNANPIYNSKFGGNLFILDPNSTSQTAVLYSDSIIYVDDNFSGSNDPLITNLGVMNDGFFVKNTVAGNWIDISTQVKENRIICLNPNHQLNGQLYISGEDINDTTHTKILFKQRNYYKFENSNWNINTKFKTPIISKLNFRYGKFNGKHNDGIFGTNIKRNNWNSAVWNSGIFINSFWNSGTMNSKSQPGEQLFNATLKKLTGVTYSVPAQTIDLSNNKGFGHNFIFDSIYYSGIINNGNFENCNFGTSSTFSAVDVYFGLTHSYNLNIKGQLNLCDINNSEIRNSNLINNELNNSIVTNSKVINSQSIQSVIDKSEVSDNGGIKVLAADVWSYSYLPSSLGVRGILKLYISDEDLKKLNLGDAFYISRVNKEFILTNLNDFLKVKLPLETKYILDYYLDADIVSNSSQIVNNQISVSIKNKNDNKKRIEAKSYTYFVLSSSFTLFGNNISNNNINYASIDIDCREFGFYKSNLTGQLNYLINGPNNILYPFIKDSSLELTTNINKVFTNTFLHNSDIKSGYVNNSNWSSSDNINYTHNKINRNATNLDIAVQTIDTITVNLPISTKMNNYIQIPGEDMFIGDNVWINSVSHDDGNQKYSIDGRYKVLSIVNTTSQEILYLKNLDGITFSTAASGTFSVIDAESAKYTSVSKLLINNSKIGKGLFVRTGIKNSTIFDSEFDNNDRNLKSENNSKQRLVNITFKDTNNIINSGLVYASFFVNDTWNNGILYNSVWNGGTFNKGVAKSNYWLKGTFNNGTFLDSSSTQSSIPTTIVSNSVSIINQYGFSINPYYKVWLDGTFNLGEFYNSVWLNGTFNNGKFYSSNWFSGTWSNGVLGNKNLPLISTKFGYESPISISGTQSIWINGIVDNAIVGGYGNVYWLNGKFNDGEFTSYETIDTFGNSTHTDAIWYNGDFNGGRFSNLAKWKNGNFYKGNFSSYLGYQLTSPTNPSTYSLDYSWENGKFFGGVFGNSTLGTNSTWYNGEFRGGQFTGRFWYDGIFYKGEFIGSGTHSFYNSNISSVGEYNFANSYTQSYYGLWFYGNVVDVPQRIKNSERIYTDLVRKVEERREDNKVELKNMLWVNGTFSHKNGSFINSMWLNGHFDDGTFNSSIFNPYVDRQFTGSFSNSSFASTYSCIWNDGKFISDYGTGSFYISDWKTGTFNKGFMSGATWKDGIWYYGTAENIYWDNGLWKNGNWNGSPFDNTQMATVSNSQYGMIDGRTKNILLNISSVLGTSSIHINNGFSASSTGGVEILTDVNINNDSIYTQGQFSSTSSWFSSQNEQYYGVVGYQHSNVNFTPQFGMLNSSLWDWSDNFLLSTNDLGLYNATPNYAFDTHLFTYGGQNQTQFYSSIVTRGYNYTNFDVPRSNKLFATLDNNDTEVFTNTNSTYEIKIKIAVELRPNVSVEFKIGDNSILSFTFSSNGVQNSFGTNYYPKIYDVSFIYTTPITFTTGVTPNPEKQFWIRKKDGGILRLLKGSIIERSPVYHPTFNNVLYSAVSGSNVLFPNDSNFSPIGTSDNGNIISINFGNGVFRSGVWENGVWNNGYRSKEWFNEPDYLRFSNILGSFLTLQNGQIVNSSPSYNDNFTYKLDDYTWNITLQGIDSVTSLKVGDKVSIGNIVAIDVNEDRKLIKDFYRVTRVNTNDNTISVSLTTNFPIRRLEKDSDKHLIYITKNIWLSGAFLNGVFKGVWNNGLLKGYPSISIIQDSHFISGRFDGGRFVSRIAPSDPLTSEYQTGLIQSFEFIDNNVSGIVKDDLNPPTQWKKYLSYIDVNYLGNTSSSTNLNQDATTLNFENSENPSNPGQISTYAYFKNSDNLKGSITYDVLDSESQFRNAYILNSKIYKLGMKYKRYENLTPNDGNFTRALTNNYPNVPFNSINIGVDNLTSDGWTYSYLPLGFNSSFFTSYSGPLIESNVNIQTLNNLHLTLTQSQLNIPDLFYLSNGRFSFKNEDVTTLPARYYIVELDLASFSYFTTSIANSGWFDNTELLLSISTNENLRTSLKMGTSVNELFTEGLIKRQYFYNIQELKLEYNSFSAFGYNGPATGNPVSFTPETLDMYINNFSIIEVDKIPFFKYAEESDVDFRIKTPYFATAPFIDYTNTNFDFVGNVNLTFDSEGISSQGIQSTNVSVGVSQNVNGSFVSSNDTIFIQNNNSSAVRQ